MDEGEKIVHNDQATGSSDEAYRHLTRHLVTEDVAQSLVEHFTTKQILRQVAHLDWEITSGTTITNPGGRLRKMIQGSWALPPGAETAFERRFGAGEDHPSGPAPDTPGDFWSRFNALPPNQQSLLIDQALDRLRKSDPSKELFLSSLPRDSALIEALRLELEVLLANLPTTENAHA